MLDIWSRSEAGRLLEWRNKIYMQVARFPVGVTGNSFILVFPLRADSKSLVQAEFIINEKVRYLSEDEILALKKDYELLSPREQEEPTDAVSKDRS